MGLLCSQLAGRPSGQTAGIPKFIAAIQLELKKPAPEKGTVMQGLQEPRPGRGEPSLSERRLHNAGQALCFVVMFSQKPKGPIQENTHVALLYPLLLPKGISFPLLFSIVAILSQVPGTHPESERLPTHYFPPAVWFGGELPSLVHTQLFFPVPEDSIVTSSFFWYSCFISKTRIRSSLRDCCLDET